MSYRIRINEEEKGPYSFKELYQLYDASILNKETIIIEDDKSYYLAGSELENKMHNTSIITLWLLAIIPLTTRFILSMFLDDRTCMIVYFVLSVIFLAIDYLFHTKNPYINIYSLLLGLLILPYYLYYRKSNWRSSYGPLIAWTIIFILQVTYKTQY